ncbi:thiol-disulfide oxidoreductase DCC family protein [Paenibacillus abyssi]|uniref:Thiol-disulfide oxidoreductase DCC n=1 Tax=Paenibacillus abyssi TaxID=1340531 RepID=A0A917CUM5_9BACL|nr:DCC1-like thiol-disulfide oxidoreductase family protein [Paenibacillus abyssi]GGF98207.1 hypothetical protein GCM10010916_14300 [Paenibacillus abyssi]
MNNDVSRREEPALLLIDGHCNLCHAITRFVIKRDAAMRFQFASIQSKAGQRLLAEGSLAADDLDTFVMIQNGRYYTKSDAALRVFGKLGRLWPLLYPLIVFPAFIRDIVYDYIAGRRYRWFGRNEVCLMPTAELRRRFIEDAEEGSQDE